MPQRGLIFVRKNKPKPFAPAGQYINDECNNSTMLLRGTTSLRGKTSLRGTKQNVIARNEAKRHCEARSKTSLRGTKQSLAMTQSVRSK